MCGIFGILSKTNYKISQDFIYQALKTLSRRGPDSSDSWISEDGKFGLGHTRLSIQDLSQRASQPMFNNNHSVGIVYNGEIYNHNYLRNSMAYPKEIKWISSSDTETILNTYINFGLKKTLDFVNGMFAFAIIDLNENKLFLCRDRFGEKPLYYSINNNSFIFCSDLNFLNTLISKDEISRNSLYELISYGYISSPNSIYKNVKKILPGQYLEINLTNLAITNFNYWSAKKEYKKNYNQYENYNEEKVISILDNKFSEVVNDYMISDVEVGSLLSGGIDSSLITSYLSKISKNKIKTFNLGFNDINYDESINAKEVAGYLSTDHKTIVVSKNECLDAISKLKNIYSEPFADSSQVPTYLISKFASQYVKVVLTGDGGDELFGGYNRYIHISKILNYPIYLKKIIIFILSSLPYHQWNIIFKNFNKLIKNNNTISQPGDKIYKIIEILNCANEKEAYFKLTRSSELSNSIVMGCEFEDNYKNNWDDNEFNFLKNENEKMMLQDILYYMTDDILCKVDRASMFNSLETRQPFLDQRIFDESSKIPIKYKIKNNSGKYILKKLLFRKIPKNIFKKIKTGFAFPIDDLLQTSLYEWCNDLLDYKLIKDQGLFNPKTVEFIKNSHLSKKLNFHKEIWSLLMFQSWYLDK